MTTKREPLLSDMLIGTDLPLTAFQVRDIYESARAKDAELIEMALIAVLYAPARVEVLNFLFAAEAAGFTPSEP